MFKLNWIYTALFALLLFSGGCDKLIYDDPVDEGSDPTVYLSVSYGGAAKLRSSSSDPNNPTINQDTEDREDWVHDLALFVFDTGTGALVTKYFDEGNNNKISNSFVIELTPGKRDFYFVANMPEPANGVITNKASMETYMNKDNALDGALYNAATATKGFPMARVYLNQEVKEGGTVYQPAPFKPNGNEDQVLLVRVVAKLEVQINDDEFKSVESITLKNAYRDYHLQHGSVVNSVVTTGFPLSTTPVAHYSDITLSKNEDKNTFFAYMPEAIVYNNTQPNSPVWNTSDDTADQKPINYFVIKTTSDEFEVPIITANKDYNFTDDYLKFATGQKAEQPDYNIFRNRLYKYIIKNIASNDIEIGYNIKDWELVPTSLYMGYGYNVEVDESGKVTITNTVDACPPHTIKLVAKNGAKFSDDSTEAIFVDDTPLATKSFQLDLTGHKGGVYLEIWYNNYGVVDASPVKTFSK